MEIVIIQMSTLILQIPEIMMEITMEMETVMEMELHS